MKGDLTRDTFNPLKHYTRVLMQQGRVQLDADWNEQAAILLHYLQALAADLIGPYGSPAQPDGTPGAGFAISQAKNGNGTPIESDFAIGKGHYYVDGILCENDDDTLRYTSQINYPLNDDTKLTSGSGDYFIYLDVWERHLTYVEVEDAEGSVISMREVALNGPDTATRAQVVWQVKAWSDIRTCPTDAEWEDLVNLWQPINRGRLKARAVEPESVDTENPCITPPESSYRGAENQLYRVEIHDGGKAGQGATFKWSRENGSVIFPIDSVAGKNVIVKSLGYATRFGLQPDDWVEIVDDDYTLQNKAEPLLQVDTADPDTNTVTLKDTPVSHVGQDPAKHPLLRRWDQHETENSQPTKDGVAIVEGQDDQGWIELEDDVQIQFQPAPGQAAHTYRTGDYWLIPARTATGDVEWPGPKGAPEAQDPHGVLHHYAPLWIISITGGTVTTTDSDKGCRRIFKQLGS